MFERFTEEAIKVIMLSQEARHVGHNCGYRADPSVWLQKEPHGKVLKLGVNLIEAREEVETIGRGSGFIGVEILSPSQQARVMPGRSEPLGHDWHRTLALSLIRMGKGGCRVLETWELTQEKSGL